MQELSFGNYNNATTNGSQLGSTGFAANNLSMGTAVQSGGGGMDLSNMGTTPTQTVLDSGGQTGAQTGGGNFWSKDGGAGLILGGVQVLGNLWSTFQQHKMAKEQMSFAREQWDTNLTNQTQTYNTALEDRIRSRHSYTGQGEADTQAYLNENEL